MKSAIIATSLLVADAIVMHVGESGYNYGVLDGKPTVKPWFLGGGSELPWWQFLDVSGSLYYVYMGIYKKTRPFNHIFGGDRNLRA